MLIKSDEVAKRLGCSVGHLLKELRYRDGFPKPSTLFKRPFRWSSDDIDNLG